MEHDIKEPIIHKINSLSRRLYKINIKISDFDEIINDEFNRNYYISTRKKSINSDKEYYNIMISDNKYKKLMNKKLLIETELDFYNRLINSMESMF